MFANFGTVVGPLMLREELERNEGKWVLTEASQRPKGLRTVWSVK